MDRLTQPPAPFLSHFPFPVTPEVSPVQLELPARGHEDEEPEPSLHQRRDQSPTPPKITEMFTDLIS